MHTRISSDSCSCSSYYCQEDKTTHIYKYFTTVCPTRLHSPFLGRISQCSCNNSKTLSSFSITFHDLCCFPWLSRPGKWENGPPELHDQWAPCLITMRSLKSLNLSLHIIVFVANTLLYAVTLNICSVSPVMWWTNVGWPNYY